jgi:hypothetical protein
MSCNIVFHEVAAPTDSWTPILLFLLLLSSISNLIELHG